MWAETQGLGAGGEHPQTLISITNWEGWSPWLLVFLQSLAAEQGPAWWWQRRNRAKVVVQPKTLEEALVEVGDWNVWIDMGLGWVVRKMKTQDLGLTKR